MRSGRIVEECEVRAGMKRIKSSTPCKDEFHSERYFLHENGVMTWRRKDIIERMLRTSPKINTDTHGIQTVIAILIISLIKIFYCERDCSKCFIFILI